MSWIKCEKHKLSAEDSSRIPCPDCLVEKARSEVLAACLAKIRERYMRLPGFDDASPEFFDLIKEIEQLHPAASDLEALLREAEIRGAMDELALIETERGHRGWFAFDLYEQTGARLKYLKEELVDLEQARSEGKG